MSSLSLAAPVRQATASTAGNPLILQRKCACGTHSSGGECDSCRSRKSPLVQRRSDVSTPPAAIPPAVGDALRTPGRPLDNATRSYMEQRLGHDFSGVRVHTDTVAGESAQALGARAYAVGRDLVFRPGAYTPSSYEGRRLLAHELAHVVQQDRSGLARSQFSKPVSHPGDASEREADAVAEDVAQGREARVTGMPSAAVQGDFPIGAAVGLGVLGAVGAGLGIAALAGAFKSKKWGIAQANTDGTPYSSDVNLTFTPDKDMNCPEIAFVQTVKFSDVGTRQSVETIPNYVSRRTGTGWTLDRIDARQYGWYGYNNNGRPGGNVSPGSAPAPLTPATLHDTPSDSRPSSVMEFETCAICRSGGDANKIYSCFHWGFSVDAANKLKSLPTAESAGPSADFNEAVKQWNIQAAGPAAARNAPTQQSLGPFK